MDIDDRGRRADIFCSAPGWDHVVHLVVGSIHPERMHVWGDKCSDTLPRDQVSFRVQLVQSVKNRVARQSEVSLKFPAREKPLAGSKTAAKNRRAQRRFKLLLQWHGRLAIDVNPQRRHCGPTIFRKYDRFLGPRGPATRIRLTCIDERPYTCGHDFCF